VTAAVLLFTEQGWNIRTTDCGEHLRTLTVPGQDSDAPTVDATRVLTEHGWTVTERWTPASPDGWVAHVEYDQGEVPA
jgi:hypothetical protein